MLNVELIPFVGFDVEKNTPEEKNEDLGKVKTHYFLNSSSLENNFELMSNFKELKSDKTFQEARKYIIRKDFISVKKYNSVCATIANEMKLSRDDLSKSQKFTQELNSIAKKNPTGKFVFQKK